MTENQRKFLTEYLGECWHEVCRCEKCGYANVENSPRFCFCVPPVKTTPRVNCMRVNRTFTDLKDKQDLLEKVIEKGEWMEFFYYLWATLSVETFGSSFFAWLIQLPPIETAELVYKWKVKY